MQSIFVLLSYPNPDDPLVPAIAAQLRTDKARHDEIARNWTSRYANVPLGEACSDATASAPSPGDSSAAVKSAPLRRSARLKKEPE